MKRLRTLKLSKKLSGRRGFSLTELMVVLSIMSLVGAAIAVGISSAARAYNDIRAGGESSVLCGTIAAELTDTLRFAENISDNGSDAVFTSRRYGIGVSVGTDSEGYITTGNKRILSEPAYTGLTANANVRYDGEHFMIRIEIFRDSQLLTDAEFMVSPLGN